MARPFGRVTRHQTGTDSESDLKVQAPESAMQVSLQRAVKAAALEKDKLNFAQFLNKDVTKEERL